MKILSLKDAKKFMSEVKETSEKYFGVMDTPIYKGRTHYGYDLNEGFFLFSQGRTYFSNDQFKSIVWNSRKEINRGGWESELY